MNTTHNKRGDKQTYRDVTPEELGATHPNPQGWEKEFEALIDNPNEELGMKLSQNDEDVIKSFIHSVESRAREEERLRCVKVLEGMKKDIVGRKIHLTESGISRSNVRKNLNKTFSYNDAISDAIQSINKESGGK